ncbi:MAG: hypothetical protein ABI673_05445 [Novosphingobium sp.]
MTDTTTPKPDYAASNDPVAPSVAMPLGSGADQSGTTTGTDSSNADVAKEKFSKAMDEARQGAAALGKQAQENAGVYRDKLAETSEAWKTDAKAYADQAKERAAAMAEDGKVRASEAISGLGKIVSDTAGTIDEKLGPKYGDYARTAARSIQETAAKIEAKDLGELGNDAREVIKKSPAIALGVAAVVGFMFARMFKGNSSED